MAIQRLEIEISSDYDSSGVSQAGDQLERLGNEADEASGKFVRLDSAFASAAQRARSFSDSAKLGLLSFKGLNGELTNAGVGLQRYTTINEKFAKTNATAVQSLQKLTTSSGNATGAVAGLTNIIRDAPYGIIGIGNNITQLSDAFGQLQRQTGSASGALRALFGGIFSPGGLVSIGLSAAVTLWTLYSQSQQKAASEAKKAADEIKKTADILKEGAANLAQYNSEASAEIVTLNGLLKIAADETKSREQRTNALKALKTETKGYLNDLTLETAGTDKARAALDEYNKSLFNSALIKAYKGQIDELAKSFAQNEQAVDGFNKEIDRLDAEKLKALQPGINVDLQKAADLQLEQNKNINDRTKALEEQRKAQQAINDIGLKIADVTSKIQVVDSKSTKEATERYKANQDLLKTLRNIQSLTFDNLNLQIGGGFGIDKLNIDSSGIEQEIGGLTSLEKGVVSVQQGVDTALVNLNKSAQDNLARINGNFKTSIDEFSKEISKITENNVISGIASISSAIGEAIVSGNASGILKSFVNGISKFLEELGTTLIATGIGIEAFKSSLSSLQGGTAIAAGAALILAAGAFRALASGGIGSFATGGTAFGSQLAIVGDNPERKEHILSDSQLENIAGSGRGFTDGQVVGVTRGQDILLIWERAQTTKRRSRG